MVSWSAEKAEQCSGLAATTGAAAQQQSPAAAACEHEQGEVCIKGRWYAAQTLPQTFSWTSEFLENICEKKLQECCTLFTLYEFKVLALINNLNTISKVLHADAAA